MDYGSIARMRVVSTRWPDTHPVRLRPEIAGALKRASLERQLAAGEFFSQQEIVERAITAWLNENSQSVGM